MQFRAEVFNLANRVQFSPPATAVGSATFGIISSQANNPRSIHSRCEPISSRGAV